MENLVLIGWIVAACLMFGMVVKTLVLNKESKDERQKPSSSARLGLGR